MSQLEDNLTRADGLVRDLEESYARFAQRSVDLAEERAEAKRGIAGFFRTVFSPSQEVEPAHEQFLQQTEALTLALAGALESLPEGAERAGLARRAAVCVLAPRPAIEKSPEEWFMTAAEAFALPLLPFLSPEALGECRENMLRLTSRRFLFPKQKEVLDQIDLLLGDSGQS